MRRFLVLLSLGCGCGRIGFDRSAGAGDATGDTPRLVVDAPLLSLEAGQCPNTYVRVATSCYRLVTTPTGWLPSELACEADGVGAHLVVVTDDAERLLLLTSAVRLVNSTWIGTTKRQVQYRTVIDTVPFLALGTQTEPSEDCLSIPADGMMYLHTCSDQRAFLCEFDGDPAVPTAY